MEKKKKKKKEITFSRQYALYNGIKIAFWHIHIHIYI